MQGSQSDITAKLKQEHQSVFGTDQSLSVTDPEAKKSEILIYSKLGDSQH